jgi:diguanylate cyclase (GGDEF)-like protein/putative nucleotidyltransferase with HDIG domain/PAS domain S-box-containing protein
VRFFSPALRTSAGLASLSIALLFVAAALGLLPDRDGAILAGRKALCEALAIDCSVAVQRRDGAAIEPALRAVVERNADIVSAAVRRADGTLLVEIGNHKSGWTDVPAHHSTPTHVHVPISQGDVLWGTVELQFQPLDGADFRRPLRNPWVRLIGFVGGAGVLVYFFYLRLILGRQGPDQPKVVPERIRDTFNALAEGVLILDKDQRIALANEAFGRLVAQSPSELQGRKVAELPWAQRHAEDAEGDYPWTRALCEGSAQTGAVLSLRTGANGLCKLSVNSTPIVADDGTQRGALATFDDLTVVQKKNVYLRKLLQKLKHSRGEIRRQNLELKALATRDPLTGCLNRRAFFATFETYWNTARRFHYALGCVMLDVDHFKAINDGHGHATGDQVLQRVAQVLQSCVRESDLICRYGGEEFCILLPHASLAEASQAAERFRQQVQAQSGAGLAVTASFGVSALSLGARSLQELLDQADKALYAAKRSGRNRVVCWDALPSDFPVSAPSGARAEPPREAHTPVPISFHAVTALVSALAYRHLDTGEHSRRVADLCVATASGLMSQSQRYLLELAGLLHDIGKLGVPDAILLKPAPLTDDEWKVMRSHEQIGVEIITAAFTSPELTAIVRHHHCRYEGQPDNPEAPRGQGIPLGARILAIADAYDAIVFDRVYRKARSREEAFAELRRCAGTQFDPELVERFIGVVLARDETRGAQGLVVSKQTALRIGLEIEKLAGVVDAQDLATLGVMAARIRANASEHDIRPLADAAARLEQAAAARGDWTELTQLTLELLELCRSTQVSYLPSPQPSCCPASPSEISPPSQACLVS